MANRDTDVSTPTLLRRYWKNVRRHYKDDQWIEVNADKKWWSEYKRRQHNRNYYRDRVLHIAEILRERGVYLG